MLHSQQNRVIPLTGGRCMQLRLVLISVLITAAVFGQSSTGTATLSGEVSDTTGAVVQQARITVTSKDTGFVFTSVTTNEGTWYVPNLNPGNYQLKIEAAGFRGYVQDGIVL